MKYSLLLAAVAAQRFPVDDIFHTHCTMNTTLADSCDKAWAAIENTVKTIADPALGTYSLYKEQTNSWVWATRKGAPHNPQVDDILFTFEQSQDGTTCSVTGKSRRQTKSLYDYETNFCNVYNVLRSDEVAFTPVQWEKKSCRYAPATEPFDLTDVRCSQY